nr:MAG TPA: hypothetical protein [Caudoviricetes sp.]
MSIVTVAFYYTKFCTYAVNRRTQQERPAVTKA